MGRFAQQSDQAVYFGNRLVVLGTQLSMDVPHLQMALPLMVMFGRQVIGTLAFGWRQ